MSDTIPYGDDYYEQLEAKWQETETSFDDEDGFIESDKYYELIEDAWAKRLCTVPGLPNPPISKDQVLDMEPCLTKVPFGYYMEYMKRNNPAEFALQWDALDEEERREALNEE